MTLLDCKKLVEVHLQGCSSSIDESTFNSIFSQTPNIQIVDLDGCNITDTTLITILNLNDKVSLHTLSVSGCKNISELFLPSLFRHKELKILKLYNCIFVTSEIVIQISQNLPNLQFLDIAMCKQLPKDPMQMKSILSLFPNTFISHQSLDE